MLCLRRLTLTDFRNYPHLTWHPSTRISVLHGPNGSGKTNLLEAVSLLVPGRGLRNARTIDLPRQGGPGTWAAAGRFDTVAGPCDIGTGTTETAPDRRVFRLDGSTPRSQAELAQLAAAVWLTPQMDRLFQEGASGRRRFLDRLVWALEPTHAREVAAHDTAVRSRNRLLAERRGHPAWLAGLEDSIARHAVAITAARLDLIGRLNARMQAGGLGAFPAASLALTCTIADRLADAPALAVEDWLRAALAASRTEDAAEGLTRYGAHRADWRLLDAASGVPMEQASTGQQKALLISVILVHAEMISAARGFAPLLLLDEPAVHLDTARRAALWDVLARLPAQSFVTGTDVETFLPLADHAMAWEVGVGGLSPDGRFISLKSAGSTVPEAR